MNAPGGDLPGAIAQWGRALDATISGDDADRLRERIVLAQRCTICCSRPHRQHPQTTKAWKRQHSSEGVAAKRSGRMPIVDHATRLITCKLVYYGPGRSGKTTNLTYLHSALPSGQVGSLTSLATRRDRTLFFDYLPVDLGTVGAYRVRFQLYTVPGQPYYRAIRQLVLQGADGVAFVADSQRHRWDDNIESLQDMHANLAEHGVDARICPS